MGDYRLRTRGGVSAHTRYPVSVRGQGHYDRGVSKQMLDCPQLLPAYSVIMREWGLSET